MRSSVLEGDRAGTLFAVLGAISFSHLLNDTIQSLLPAIYPLLKASLRLTFAQVGLITFSLQFTASLLQPVVGWYTDRRSVPYALVAGMACSLAGLLLLSAAGSFRMVLGAAAMIGLGSSIFHPESSRIARMASGGRYGFAQSFFQLGGQIGTSCGPLLAAFIVVPHGQSSVAWCAALALVAIGVLWRVGGWQQERARTASVVPRGHTTVATVSRVSTRRLALSIAILIALVFSKYFYLASLNSYYTFYLMDKFHVSVQRAQIDLFLFLAAVAAGTILGGPLGDRFGRKWVIWASIVGVLPFTVLLPYVTLFWTRILASLIGLILASAFSAIVVYAQELVPGRIGLISGLFFGLAFGMAGLGAALLGVLADRTSIDFVYRVCGFLPLIGLLTGFLPNIDHSRRNAVVVPPT